MYFFKRENLNVSKGNHTENLLGILLKFLIINKVIFVIFTRDEYWLNLLVCTYFVGFIQMIDSCVGGIDRKRNLSELHRPSGDIQTCVTKQDEKETNLEQYLIN